MFAQNIPPEVTGNRLSSGLRYSPLCFHFFTSFPSHFAPSRFSGRPIHYTLYSLAMFMAEIVHGHRCRSWPVPFKFLYRIPNTCVTYRGKKPDCYITQGRLVTGTKSYLALWRFVIWWCKYLTGVIFLLYVGEGHCGGRKQTFPGTGTRDGHTKKDGRKSKSLGQFPLQRVPQTPRELGKYTKWWERTESAVFSDVEKTQYLS